MASACWCSPTERLCSTAPRASCTRQLRNPAPGASSRHSSPSSETGAIDGDPLRGRDLTHMGWLFVKDLQILRRSPLVTVLLVVYPVAIAVLIGFALSRGPEKPRIAFFNQVPANQSFNLGGSEGEFDKNAAKQ